MNGERGALSDAVARFRSQVADAVTNARRAAGDAREQSAKFRKGTEELRAKPARSTRPVAAEAPPPPPEDEDFSQRRFLDDDRPDTPPTPRESAEDGAPESAEPVESMTDSAPDTSSEDTRSSEDEDFSQQRILIDATPESYRPEALPAIGFDLPNPEKPS